MAMMITPKTIDEALQAGGRLLGGNRVLMYDKIGGRSYSRIFKALRTGNIICIPERIRISSVEREANNVITKKQFDSLIDHCYPSTRISDYFVKTSRDYATGTITTATRYGYQDFYTPNLPSLSGEHPIILGSEKRTTVPMLLKNLTSIFDKL